MKDPVPLCALAKMIDHSLLHPTMTDDEIAKGCALAKRYKVASACIKPYCIPMARDLLAGSGVKVCAVIAFPHGNSMTSIKVREAEAAVLAGGQEIDMVVNIGKVLGADWAYVSEEIKAINDVVIADRAILKVIFETDYLEDDHLVRLCGICSEYKVAFAKTSSGYGFVKQPDGTYHYKGATDHHVKLMRKHLSPSVQIKAAGGIRTLDEVLRFRELGVTRIGATATETILEEAKRRGIS
jgi:deoxyribose-phosphate aldolase